MVEKVLEKVVAACHNCSFIQAIVLGGSRATGTATEQSDIDIGIYYDSGKVDYEELNAIAKQLDDAHREHLICKEGEWGNWVNCGGWLVINGYHVDMIMRDWTRVKDILQATDEGVCSCHYQTGHPHAYIDVMYRGGLASCKVLYAKGNEFLEKKQQAEVYPPSLKKSLMEFFLFEADFSCMLAEKSAESNDTYYLAGHLFRAVSALNQVLFAFNEQWLLNEKKAVFRVETFLLKPHNYHERVDRIFGLVKTAPSLSVQELRKLCSELKTLCSASSI